LKAPTEALILFQTLLSFVMKSTTLVTFPLHQLHTRAHRSQII